jgi:hypothetical protein
METRLIRITKIRAVFVPQKTGIFILLIIALAFTAGVFRQELALVLAGAVFLAVWTYCLLMTLVLALLHNRRARRVSIRISPHEIAAGESAEAVYSGEKNFQLPGILVRCRLLLVTKDGRRIEHDFNPADSAPHCFTAKKRGAYFSPYNELAVFDTLGMFRFAFRLPAENGALLLAAPHAENEPLPVNARAGESKLKPEFSFQRTDNLINHRPYIPGDDPRRINWKLYGHGGGLFVREGEREPPPQSNIIVIIDTEYDPLLYNARAARHGIDVLCENALAAAIACTESGMNMLIGYTAGNAAPAKPVSSILSAREIAAALAWPAALPLPDSAEFPAVPEGYGIIILALPRSDAVGSNLDLFLNNTAHRRTEKNKARTVELLFLYDSVITRSEHFAAAEACAASYSQRPGIMARMINNEE